MIDHRILDNSGGAVVEATILFPIIIIIFAALVLLAAFLPAQAALQRATSYAATALSTQHSDSWLYFDESSMSLKFLTDKSQLTNVYSSLFASSGDISEIAENIVIYVEGKSVSSRAGSLEVTGEITNRIIYSEILVSARRTIPLAMDFSLIGFPSEIVLSASSTAVVKDGDEFVRNINLAGDFISFIAERYELENVTEAIGNFGSRLLSLLGW